MYGFTLKCIQLKFILKLEKDIYYKRMKIIDISTFIAKTTDVITIDRNSTNERMAKVNNTKIITLHRITGCFIERSGDTLLG